VLILAEKYGQAPEEVESWDQYWFERAVLKLRAEKIHDDREETRREKARRK
jgi:hypothetical protein